MSNELVPTGLRALAIARRAEEDAAQSDDPWIRADVQAARWLRSPRLMDSTRDQYRRIWEAWRTWCQLIDVPPLDATRTDLEAYTTMLEKVGNPAILEAKRRPLSRRSVGRHMAVVSSFYRRAISDKLTDLNPVPPGDRPKVSRKSKQPHLTVDELRAIIAVADRDPRRSVLITLLVLACLRITEALRARVEDLSYEGGHHYLWVVRKGDQGEKVPLPPEAWSRISTLVGRRKSGFIVETASGKPVDRKAAFATVRRIGKHAGITAVIGPHTLRHAYITRGHELGIPVDRLQVAAGHSSVDTTRGYDRSHLDAASHPSFAIAEDLVPSQSG
jgi:integrase/recombinase XerD